MCIRDRFVVIIDAGSRGWHPDAAPWPKSVVNKKIMIRFWQHAEEVEADISEIRRMWRSPCNPLDKCLKWSQTKWDEWPWLRSTTSGLRATCLATEQHEIEQMQQTAAHQLLLLITRHDIPATERYQFEKVCLKAHRESQIQPDDANAENTGTPLARHFGEAPQR